MKKIVLTFGSISGVILVAMLAILMPLCLNGTIDIDHQEILGYSSMFMAFLMVFFGIRSYRDTIGGGAVTFGRAFKVGILISLFACAAYVIAWELYYFTIGGDFTAKYTAHLLEKMRVDGATEAQLAAKAKEMVAFAKMYDNPFVNIGLTFLEVFPIGLVMTLVSAAILRRKTPGSNAPAAVAAEYT
jgi:hypothetical protein